MKLDFSSLIKALLSLEKAIERAQGVPLDEEVRDAVIQRFEYTFELCWKMLKRVIEHEATVPALVDQLSFNELLREAAEKGILANPQKWMIYREQRNITSHTYDVKKAESVYKTAVEFALDAQSLLQNLKNRSK